MEVNGNFVGNSQRRSQRVVEAGKVREVRGNDIDEKG
jgi:hypothetical protein